MAALPRLFIDTSRPVSKDQRRICFCNAAGTGSHEIRTLGTTAGHTGRMGGNATCRRNWATPTFGDRELLRIREYSVGPHCVYFSFLFWGKPNWNHRQLMEHLEKICRGKQLVVVSAELLQRP